MTGQKKSMSRDIACIRRSRPPDSQGRLTSYTHFRPYPQPQYVKLVENQQVSHDT